MTNPPTDAERRNAENPRCPHCGKVGPIIETVPYDTGAGFFMVTCFCKHCRKIITVNVIPGSLGPTANLVVPPDGIN